VGIICAKKNVLVVVIVLGVVARELESKCENEGW
jgi:hypothetical protein